MKDFEQLALNTDGKWREEFHSFMLEIKDLTIGDVLTRNAAELLAKQSEDRQFHLEGIGRFISQLRKSNQDALAEKCRYLLKLFANRQV